GRRPPELANAVDWTSADSAYLEPRGRSRGPSRIRRPVAASRALAGQLGDAVPDGGLAHRVRSAGLVRPRDRQRLRACTGGGDAHARALRLRLAGRSAAPP